MKKISCPKCGMELVKLNDDERMRHEYACLECHLEITIEETREPYTVNELIKALTEISAKGMGNRFVLVPNLGDEDYADYIFIEGIGTEDTQEACVYLKIPSAEDDAEWGELYGL
jgi:DNA-directed RNA polymerase subunit RPC12/RpoP